MAAATVRNAILKHMRIKVTHVPAAPSRVFAPSFLHRFFSDELKGSFLDKSEVADRVITVVKNFQKVDPSKQCNNVIHFWFEIGILDDIVFLVICFGFFILQPISLLDLLIHLLFFHLLTFPYSDANIWFS
ncbi:hypothetical protein AMTRI_Chr01g131460 [Amborella trichopoda]